MEGAGLSELRTEQTILSLLRRVEELRIDVKYWNRVHKAKRWLERSLGGWAGVWHEVALLSKRCGVLNGLLMRSILLWAKSDLKMAVVIYGNDELGLKRAQRKLHDATWAYLDFLDFRCPDPNPDPFYRMRGLTTIIGLYLFG
jgi:hypothetical protein